jgi:hypothetical protein
MDSKEKAQDYINKAFDYVIKEFIDETDEDPEYELALLVDAVLDKRAGVDEIDDGETYIEFEPDPGLERGLNEEGDTDD